MTSNRVSLRRSWGRPLALLAASGLAIAGVAGAGSASAGDPPAPPDFTYSSAVTAIGVQAALQRNPDFSSLPDPFDVEAPHSEAKLDSFGTSQADGHVVNLNGLGGIPGLVCLAAGASNCNAIPIGQVTAGLIPTFPPPDPVDAHATYPAHQDGSAPLLGKTPAQLSVDQSGFSLDAGTARAAAHEFDTATTASEQNLEIANALSIGSARTATIQTATADSLTTTAVATLSNVGLGGKLLNIGHVRSTTTVVSKPGKPATDETTTVLSDVTAAGLAATIDASGVHINKSGLPANVVAQAQKLVNQVLKAAGISVSLATVSRTDDANGHTVGAAGLLLTFDHSVSGTPPVTVAPPPGIPCPPQLQNFPLDPCSGISLSLDGKYHGDIALGQVGVVSMAQPNVSGTSPSPSGVGPTINPTSGGTTTGVGGVPAPGGPAITTTNPPPGPGPVVAARQQTVADQLKNVSDRLVWFFPLFALGVLALIGRLRVPARLPGPK
ncbi:MAG TPA: hypothetical protein VG650_04455 [Mycobacteriales bacterium]|nr:hypothetical protein [Mycobacteriales bacterium]